MISAVIDIQRDRVTVKDANGETSMVLIELTPLRKYLTQATKRAILATGFLLPFGEDLATDRDVINDVLQSIRLEVLGLLKENKS